MNDVNFINKEKRGEKKVTSLKLRQNDIHFFFYNMNDANFNKNKKVRRLKLRQNST